MNKESIDIIFNKGIKSILQEIESNIGKITEEDFKKIRKKILNEINDIKRIFYDSGQHKWHLQNKQISNRKNNSKNTFYD